MVFLLGAMHVSCHHPVGQRLKDLSQEQPTKPLLFPNKSTRPRADRKTAIKKYNYYKRINHPRSVCQTNTLINSAMNPPPPEDTARTAKLKDNSHLANMALPEARQQSYEEIYGPPENVLEIEVYLYPSSFETIFPNTTCRSRTPLYLVKPH